MRLTLRTLLAYMDDILEPADHEDLGKKIEASDFATELIHRSRDTVRRLRLGAPAVLADGSDDVLDSLDLGDANAVAEYLDNTLPPEQVAEFERMCLEPGNEADMHLAEVASCHHVLTMVLGEPAEVETDLKARMYQLPDKLASGQKLRIEPAHTAPAAAPPVQESQPAAAPAPPVAQPTSTHEAELPDYLKEAVAAKRRSRRWAIATTLLATCGVVVFWFASAPPAEPPSDLADSGIMESFEGDIQIEGLSDLSTQPTTDPSEPSGDAPLFVPQVPPVDSAPVEAAEEGPPRVATEPSKDLEIAEPAVIAESDAESAADVEVSTGIEEMELPGEQDLQAGIVPDDPGTEDASPLASSGVTDSANPTVAVDSSIEQSQPTDPVDGDASMVEEKSSDTGELIATDEQPVEETPAGPQLLGKYMGNNDVLLIHNAVQQKWIRMPPRSPISTGEILLTLPKFRRTHVVLSDVNTYLWGGTRLHIPVERFEVAAGDAELNLEIAYGRVLFNAGLGGSKVAVLLDDQLREFTLSGSSSLAVEVQRVFVPGSDYENEPAPIRATWYLTSGSVEWPTAAGGSQTIEGQSVWKTIEGIDEIPETVETYPEWIDREPVTDVERTARENLDKELTVGEPVDIRLLELTDGKGLGRRKEVRILAASAGIHVGEFEPLVKALNDSEQNRAWESLIIALRQALALSPEIASQVRQAFVNIRGDEAAEDLMEMVNGYGRAQIGDSREAVQSGALSQLIKWLDHDSLDYRVLAIHNIREITGKSKGYRPDDSLKRRKSSLRKIWAEFESNELMPLP